MAKSFDVYLTCGVNITFKDDKDIDEDWDLIAEMAIKKMAKDPDSYISVENINEVEEYEEE